MEGHKPLHITHIAKTDVFGDVAEGQMCIG